MLRRLALLSVLALAAGSHSAAQTLTPIVTVSPASDDIRVLRVFERDGMLSVELTGESLPISGSLPPPFKNPWSKRAVQAWLLRVDGTAVPPLDRQGGPMIPGGFGHQPSNAPPLEIYVEDVVRFNFVRVAREVLVGIVVSVDGRMLVRDIPAK